MVCFYILVLFITYTVHQKKKNSEQRSLKSTTWFCQKRGKWGKIAKGQFSTITDSARLAIFTISGVKPTFGTYWCVTLPYLDRFLWNFVMYLSPTGATSGSITNLLLFFFQIWQAHIWWKSGIFLVLDFTCHYYNSYHFVLVHLEQFLFWCCYGQVSNLQCHFDFQVLTCIHSRLEMFEIGVSEVTFSVNKWYPF